MSGNKGQLRLPEEKNYFGGFNKLIDAALEHRLRFARTQVPAIVLTVDENNSTVKVAPLIKTMFDPLEQLEFEVKEILEVPILFQSVNDGEGRLTFPVKEGSRGVLVCSDRHTENYMASSGKEVVESGNFETLGTDGFWNVLGFRIEEIFTPQQGKSFDPNHVVMTHGKFTTTWKKDGSKIDTNGTSTVSQSSNGTITATVGGATFTLTPDGKITGTGSEINLNGVIIKSNGDVTFPTKMTGPLVEANLAASSSVTKGGEELPDNQHTHSAGSYEADGKVVSGTSGQVT